MVTHPEMTRYFMTISEAVQLVLLATSIGNGGEIFVLDMGEPVRIMDLARNMITLSGFEPDKDIEIKVVGSRPGERLHEALVSDLEEIIGREFGKILRIGFQKQDQTALNRLQQLGNHFLDNDDQAILKALKEIVPEYMPNAQPPHPSK
jgi:FlaA1/EpsC-like NDP-sugar epimerase